MKDDIELSISKQKFSLNHEEAEFIAEHLSKALKQKDLNLNFTRHQTESDSEIAIVRGNSASDTDC